MPTEQIKIKARDELIRLAEKDTGTAFRNLNAKQQSIQATKFYIREIHNPTRFQISEDDLEEGLVDGKDDLGVDFIHRDDAKVLIIQSKFRMGSAQEDGHSISHFQSVLTRLRNPKLAPNRHLREIITDIDWDGDSLELVFLTFSALNGQAREISLQPAIYPQDVDELDLRCDWKFLDETELNIELRAARNLQRGISEKPIKLFPHGEKGKRGATSVVEVDAGEYRSVIMALDARQLIRCYEELDRDSLFSLNIRNYVCNTITNKEMIHCAESDSANFFLYNNGISCLASKVQIEADHVLVQGLQVINGAQTVKALVNLDREAVRKRKTLWTEKNIPTTLVRITEIPGNYGSDAKVREKITQYNNTQNTIKISDFRSNDTVQSGLRDQFSEIFRQGRKVAYLPKRTDKIPPNSDVVRLEEFAKSVYAFLYDPTDFSGASSFLFSLDKNGGYTRVFGDGAKLWERIPDDEFKLRAGAYWLAQEFARHLKVDRSNEADPDTRAALERKWLLVYAAGCVYREKDGEPKWRERVRQLYRGDWRVDDDDGKGAAVLDVYKASKAAVITAYRNSKRHNRDFVHRNWMRAKDTPEGIMDALKTTVLPLLK